MMHQPGTAAGGNGGEGPPNRWQPSQPDYAGLPEEEWEEYEEEEEYTSQQTSAYGRKGQHRKATHKVLHQKNAKLDKLFKAAIYEGVTKERTAVKAQLSNLYEEEGHSPKSRHKSVAKDKGKKLRLGSRDRRPYALEGEVHMVPCEAQCVIQVKPGPCGTEHDSVNVALNNVTGLVQVKPGRQSCSHYVLVMDNIACIDEPSFPGTDRGFPRVEQHQLAAYGQPPPVGSYYPPPLQQGFGGGMGPWQLPGDCYDPQQMGPQALVPYNYMPQQLGMGPPAGPFMQHMQQIEGLPPSGLPMGMPPQQGPPLGQPFGNGGQQQSILAMQHQQEQQVLAEK